METWFENWYHQQEEHHWWFRSRRDFLHLLFPSSVKKTDDILDVGCASGMMVKELLAKGFESPSGADISKTALEVAKSRGISSERLAIADAHQLSPDFSPHLIIASDILEHLENDEKALANWFDVLQPNGFLILMVPAFPKLWSQHDEWNHHFRRYLKKELLGKVERSGFEVTQSGYWNCLLFPALYAWRKLVSQQKNNNDLSATQNPLVNFIGRSLFKLEHGLWKLGTRFPAGLSLYVLARKNPKKDPKKPDC